jgi:hypothetical protein
MSEELDGHWVTIDGEHVFIQGGKITKGPPNLVGRETPAHLKPKNLDKDIEMIKQRGIDQGISHREAFDQAIQNATIHSQSIEDAIKEQSDAWGDAETTAIVRKSAARNLERVKAAKARFEMKDANRKQQLSADGERSFVLHLSEASEETPIPAGLEGYPTEADGVPIFYRVMTIARTGNWTHRGTGQQFEITPERADEWVRNTTALAAAGVEPFVPGQHREKFNASDNFGWVKKIYRDGSDVKALVALYGDDARTAAARNGRSIYVVNDARDAKGKKYDGETIAHIALVPNPALPDLGPTVKIAASADGPAIEAPIYEPSVPKQESDMTPELARKLREKFSIGTDVPDAQLADKAAEKALALSADVDTEKGKVTALTADKDKLTKERDDALKDAKAKGDKVLQLSADALPTDPRVTALLNRTFKVDREQVIAAGVVSDAGMKEIDKLLFDNGNPTPAALALSAESNEPFYSRLCEILRKNPGIRHNNAVPRGATPAQRNLAASADGTPPDNYDDDFNAAKASKDAQLEARGVKV